MLSTYLVEKSYVQRESELVFEGDFVRQLVTELPGSCGRICQESFGVSVHKSDW